METFQSDDCFYEGTNSESVTFPVTFFIHIAVLSVLLIWCVIWFFFCICHIHDKNHKNNGIFTTLAEDAPENGINYGRIWDYISMGWNFFQLISFSFLDEFSIRSIEDSLFAVSWIDNIFHYVRMILLKIGGLGDLVLFSASIILIFIIFLTLLICLCSKNYFQCLGFIVERNHCANQCCNYIKVGSSSCRDFCHALSYYFTCGLCYFDNGEEVHLCCKYSFRCSDNGLGYSCCGCYIDCNFLRNIPFFLKTLLYDNLYIPILSSLIEIFICTYRCDYDPSIMNKEEAYPPLDVYSSFSCNSPYTIICFILSFFAIAFYHIRASYYICVEYDKDYADDNSSNQRLLYFEMIEKFILTVTSTMFYFQPFIPLTTDLLMFFIVLIVVIITPIRTAYTMEYSKLYISLYTIQVLTALMALLSQIFPFYSSLFSILTVCFVPVGFIFGWSLYIAPSLKGSYPYDSLAKMMLNKDSFLRLLAIRILTYVIKPISAEEEKFERDKLSEHFDKIDNHKVGISDYFSFGSIYHRGLSLDELIINAGDVLVESIRTDYRSNYVESCDLNNCKRKKTKGLIKFQKKFEDYKSEIGLEVISLLKCTYEYRIAHFLEIDGNNLVCSNICEPLSFILSRDDYLVYIMKQGILVNDYDYSNCTVRLMEEIVKRASFYLLCDNNYIIKKSTQYVFRDYLIFPLYCSNSISISLQNTLLLTILCNFYDSFFNLSNYLSLYSFLTANKKILNSNNCSEELNYNFCFYYYTAIRILEYLYALSPYLINEEDKDKISNYKRIELYNEEDLNLKKEREAIEHCCSDKELCLDISVKILNLLSSLFVNDWGLSTFFYTFINDKMFINTFRDDDEYNEDFGDIGIKEFFNRKMNDEWLLHKMHGLYNKYCLMDNILYTKFEYNKEYNEKLIKSLREKDIFQKKMKNDFENSLVSAYEERKEDEKSNNFNKRISDSIPDNNIDESSLEMESINFGERISFESIVNNTDTPIILNYIVLFLNSKIDVVREYSLITLSSLLDKEKNDKEWNKNLGPSFIYNFISNLDEWGLIGLINENVYNCVKEKLQFSNDICFSNRRINHNVFRLLYAFVDDCFDMSILLDEDKRKEYVIDNYCNEGVLEWISSFYEYEEEREKVIRLLYIVISCSSEDIVSSLFDFEDSSAFLILLENNGSDIIDNMAFLYSLQIIDVILSGKKKRNFGEVALNYLLIIILHYFNKSKNYYVHPVLKLFIQKYSLFTYKLSNEESMLLKKELFYYTNKEWNIYIPGEAISSFSSLSLIPLNFSDNGKLKTKGNSIIYNGRNFFESCIFGVEMKKV